MHSSLEFPRRFPNVLGVLVFAAVPHAIGVLILILAVAGPNTLRQVTNFDVRDHLLRSDVLSPPPIERKLAVRPARTEAVVALGERLFKDPRLSSTGKMSCATCHVPERSFTDDKPLAVGQDGVTLGRNTPALVGLESVKEFPVGGSFGKPPEMSSLEERVLLPLKDVAEMSDSVGTTIERLRKDPETVAKFRETFHENGVTSDRLATALAAYVRSVALRGTPGQGALAGDEVALDPPASRGLALFKGAGHCQSCHSGPSLTDGQLHVVSKFKQSPIRTFSRSTVPPPKVQDKKAEITFGKNKNAETELAAERAAQSPAETRPRIGAAAIGKRGGAYGPSTSLERQTLTLLDVKRTGPWFRDGSAATLSEAVRRHVAELREVGALREDIASNPFVLLDGNAPRGRFASAKAPKLLSPSAKAQVEGDDWIPAEITPEQVDDLVAFLKTLSPAG
jgi:cytochrome c peroxidase